MLIIHIILTWSAAVLSRKICKTSRHMMAARTACCPSDVRQNLRHLNRTPMDLQYSQHWTNKKRRRQGPFGCGTTCCRQSSCCAHALLHGAKWKIVHDMADEDHSFAQHISSWCWCCFFTLMWGGKHALHCTCWDCVLHASISMYVQICMQHTQNSSVCISQQSLLI